MHTGLVQAHDCDYLNPAREQIPGWFKLKMESKDYKNIQCADIAMSLYLHTLALGTNAYLAHTHNLADMHTVAMIPGAGHCLGRQRRHSGLWQHAC